MAGKKKVAKKRVRAATVVAPTVVVETPVVATPAPEPEKKRVMSERTRLLGLYEQLQNLNVHSIGDLEVLISRAD